MVTQTEIARKAGLDVSTVNKILNRTASGKFREETIRKVHRVARRLGFSFDRLKFQHRRLHPRTNVSIPVHLALTDRKGRIRDRIPALLEDISEGGARVRRLATSEALLPLGGGVVLLTDSPSRNFAQPLRGEVIRFLYSKVGLSVAIRFSREKDT